jgi:PAS domain S-box-containing protein
MMPPPMMDLASILDDLPVAVWVGKVPDGAAAYTNRAFERILGAPVASSRIEDVPQTYGIFGRDGQPYPVERLPFPRVLATGGPVMVDDIVARRPDGSVNIRAFGSPVRDEKGATTHVIVAFLDITREVAALVERNRVEAHLRFACDHAPIAIWTTDADGVITMSEGAGLAALGVKSGQLIGQNVLDIYGAHPTIPGYIRRAFAGDSFWYTVAVGDAVYHTWLTPLRGPAGEVVGLTGLSHDISELHRLQQTTIRNDRVMALGTLAASVAHEINNPLAYVLAQAEGLAAEVDVLDGLMAKMHGPEVPAARAALERVRERLAPVRSGTARIAGITRDLRTFSRPEDSSLTPVDLRAVVLSVLKLVGKEVEARARLVLELQPTRPVMGNEARLVQVVLNLVVNAIQALPVDSTETNEVHLCTRDDGAKVLLEVSDSGPGVPAADRDRIFEPFFSTKEIGKGTGLGLFVCRNIVQGLSGDVEVLDRPAGGALFRVTLPASSTGPAARAQPSRAAKAVMAAGRHVVVIEDDLMVARALTLQLRAAGYRVTTMNDGKEGLELLRSRPDADLVFCDLMMTGMTGMDLAEALTSEAPDVAAKIVFMTGGAFLPRAREFVARHLERTVDKPFDIVAETQRRLG